jgi:hypothetical protein
MTRIEEGCLAFEFSEQWNAFKLDDHRDYREGIEKIDNTKAVDFLAIFNKSELYFIEVKDFRGHRIENKERLLKGELPLELAQKVRDSLACIISAYRNSNLAEHWSAYAQLLCDKKAFIKVALWLEEDSPPLHPQLRKKAMASTRTKVFKQKLVWLTSRVLVCGSGKKDLPDVTVMNLPRP